VISPRLSEVRAAHLRLPCLPAVDDESERSSGRTQKNERTFAAEAWLLCIIRITYIDSGGIYISNSCMPSHDESTLSREGLREIADAEM
jgi:hypothetical protein